MSKTVIAVFDDYSDAGTARAELNTIGVSDVTVTARDANQTSASTGTRINTTAGDDDTEGFGHKVAQFFSSLFGSDDENREYAGHYSEAVRRGSCVLTAHVDEDVEDVVAVLERNGAVDIDKRSSGWRERGWSGYDASASPMSDDELTAEREYSLKGTNVTGTQATSGAGALNTGATGVEQTIPVIEEELKVGKREVQTGGVRVFSRMTEVPVQETVRLREERARVERRPVDRPATEGELNAFEEGVIEIRETAEEAVVSKTSRIVEEVVIGRDVSERNETVGDVVRRTDVEIERVQEEKERQQALESEDPAIPSKPSSGRTV